MGSGSIRAFGSVSTSVLGSDCWPHACLFARVGGLEPHEAQQLYFLVRREGPLRNVRLVPEAQAFLQQPWHFDVDGNLHLQVWPRDPTAFNLLLRASDLGSSLHAHANI